MAVLTNADRAQAVQRFVRGIVEANETATIDTVAIRAAVDATDAWIDSNAASYNAALPLPARTTLNAQQKAALFCWVALRRAGLV